MRGRGSMCVLSCLSLWGCGDFTNEPVAQPAPLPIIDRGEDPEPELPVPSEPEDTGPSPELLIETARQYLPEEPARMIGDFAVDGVVVRLLECYLTEAGCTLSMLLLSPDQDRESGVQSTTTLRLDRDLHRPTFVLTREVTVTDLVELDATPILLPANVAVPVQVFWRDIIRAPAFIMLNFGHTEMPLEVTGSVVWRASPDPNEWPPMDPHQVDTALRHLAECTAETPGTANWAQLPGRGKVAIEFDALPIVTGEFTGAFLMVDDRGIKHSKQFAGQLARDDETGRVGITLQTIGRSGIRGQRPTERISGWNLLLQGSAVTVNLRLCGHELIGRTPQGVAFNISGAPFDDPALALQRQD